MNNPFGRLEALRGTLPAGEDRAPDREPTHDAARFAAKIVLRRERAGRGGRTVTVIEGVLLDGAAREDLLRTLRRTLGTSGHVEGDHLVLGGDQCERAADWLRNAGAARVVVGN